METKANEEKETQPALAWYERVFATMDLATKDPVLDAYVQMEKQPEWVVNILQELSRQGLHLSPARDLTPITPKKLGQLLGQQCANLYTFVNRLEAAGFERPEVQTKVFAQVEEMFKQQANPVVASALQAAEIAGSLIMEMAEGMDQLKKNIHNAFEEALGQTNHAEAVLFFQGFARGLASPGLLPGGLSQATDATPIYYKMFVHWPEIDRLGTVTELYEFLLKVGISKPMLGDIDRLRTLCKRIKYAPGKRGRPAKAKK